jgi:alpha-beta hydrolase superfamily lysophospholipase
VLGHSLGDLVTSSSVVRDQSGLRGVVLTSAALLHTASPAVLSAANVVAFFAPTAPAPLEAAEFGRLYHGADMTDVFAGNPVTYRGRMPILVAARWMHRPFQLEPLSELDRAGALHARHGGYLDRSAGSQRLFETIAAEDKTLHPVEDGYHELLNDTDRDETLRVLLGWLERRLPPSGPGNGPAARQPIRPGAWARSLRLRS